MIADRYLNDAETVDCSLNDQFHCPTVGRLFQFNRAECVCPCGAERTEVADSEPKEICDEAGGQPIAKERVPRKRAGGAWTCESRTDSHVSISFGDGREEKRQLGRPVTVVAIQKYDYIGGIGGGHSGKTS